MVSDWFFKAQRKEDKRRRMDTIADATAPVNRSDTAATAHDDIAASASTEQREELNDEIIIEVVMNESNNGGD